eukprot:Opistho-2@82860
MPRCRALYEYVSGHEIEVSVAEGEVCKLLKEEDEYGNKEWWMVENTAGEQGFVPANYMEMMEDAPSTALSRKDSVASANSSVADAPARREEDHRDRRESVDSDDSEVEASYGQPADIKGRDNASTRGRSDSISSRASEVSRSDRASASASSHVDDAPLTLKCTICKQSINFSEIEAHSKVCSTSSAVSETEFITVTVNDPQTVGVISKSVTFAVITVTNMAGFRAPNFQVRRTYEDFLWVREFLASANPARIIPPLPSKQSVVQGTTEYFIQKRQISLQNFVKRMCNHPALRKHPYWTLFLEATDRELKKAKKEKPAKRRKMRSPSTKPERDPRLARARVYLTELERQLKELVKKIDRNVKAIIDFDPANTRETLKSICENEPLGGYLQVSTDTLFKTFGSFSIEEEKTEEKIFKQDIKDIITYLRAAKTLIDRLEEAEDDLAYWREQVRNLKAEDKKSDKAIETAESKERRSEDELRVFWQTSTFEINHFDIQKEKDFRDTFMVYVGGKIQQQQKVLGRWDAAMQKVKQEVNPAIRGIR